MALIAHRVGKLAKHLATLRAALSPVGKGERRHTLCSALWRGQQSDVGRGSPAKDPPHPAPGSRARLPGCRPGAPASSAGCSPVPAAPLRSGRWGLWRQRTREEVGLGGHGGATGGRAGAQGAALLRESLL